MMRIYVDYVSVYAIRAKSLDTYISLAGGTHKVTVQAWDSAGTVYKSSMSIAVTNSSSAVKVSISPTSSSLQGGRSQQFTATVSGTSNTSVKWLVNGVQGGNASYGTISSGGLYTAPSCPSTSSVTVKALSVYDGKTSATAGVSLTGAATAGTGGNYYVATNGSNSNDGSACRPWATISYASSRVGPGATVHVAPGTYTAAVTTSVSGTSSAPVRFISDSKWGAKIQVSSGSDSWVNNGSYVDIVGFDVSGNGQIGILNWGSHVRTLGNHVHNIGAPTCDANGGAGIDNANYSGSDNDVIGNVVHDIGPAPGACNGVQGIYQSNLRGRISNNIVYRVSSFGIHLWHAANAVIITNNTVFNNGAQTGSGSCMGGGVVVGDGDSPGGVVNDNTIVANNIIYKNGCTGVREYCYSGQTCTGTHNQYLNNVIYGNLFSQIVLLTGTQSGTIQSDPLFMNYQADGSGNYQLQNISPAVNKGTSNRAPTTDINGGPRPMGGAWDIGAYEMGAGTAKWPWF